MTLAEVGEIFSYWEQNPPAHLMLQAIARLLGWTPPAGGAPVKTLADAAPPGLAVAHGDLGMPAPLSEVALRAKNRDRALSVAARTPFLHSR